MNKFSQKSCEASIRVLETLKLFINKDLSIQDIISFFEINDPKCKTYTSEAIFKYINTIRIFGLNLAKNKDKYILLDSPTKVNFTENELKIIKLFEEYSNVLPEKDLSKNISEFLLKVEKSFSPQTRRLAKDLGLPKYEFSKIYKKYEQIIEKYEKFCNEKLKIKIEYKQYNGIKISIIAEPKEIAYNGSKVYLRIYNPLTAQIQDINFNNIIKTEQLPLKINPSNILSSVTFRLYGRLANGYKLHEGERLAGNSENSITVINQTEDETELLHRLMRYGTLCEVISPKRTRAEMYKMITDTLKQQ